MKKRLSWKGCSANQFPRPIRPGSKGPLKGVKFLRQHIISALDKPQAECVYLKSLWKRRKRVLGHPQKDLLKLFHVSFTIVNCYYYVQLECFPMISSGLGGPFILFL